MKRKWDKRAVALLICLVILVTVSVGVTLAYLFAVTDPVENTFTPASVSCDVVETFDKNVKTNVRIQNTGNTHAYIRAAIVVTWKNSKNEVHGAAPEENRDYEIVLNPENHWFVGKDGFYYYTKAVAPVTECNHGTDMSCPDCCTGVLISRCIQKAGAVVPEGYCLSVEIVASAIQSAPDHVVESQWGNAMVAVDSNNGALTVTNNGG